MLTIVRADIHIYMTKLTVIFRNFANVSVTRTPNRLFKIQFMLSCIDMRNLPPNIEIYVWSILLTYSSRQHSVLDTVMPSSVINIQCLTVICCFMETHQSVECFCVYSFLGTFTKFRKATVSFVMCVSLYVRMEGPQFQN
jgi:hypothetical protein